MNDLLFYALLIALLYYFFYYLPHQQKSFSSPPSPPPFTQDHRIPVIEFPSSQSEPVNPEDPEIEQALDQLIKNLQQLNKSLK